MKSISAKEKAKLRRWLKLSVEKVGTVNEETMTFTANNKTGPVMFHTHPTDEKDGGFSAPSIKDMKTFIRMRRITPVQYVISERGIYRVEIHCQVRKFTQLMKDLTKMRQDLDPGRGHHQQWLKKVNSISPCLDVTFKKL